MRIISYLIKTVFLSLIAISNAESNNCADVIKLSLVSTESVHSEESFTEDAAQFCKEYSKSSSTSKSGGGSVGYAGFTLGATSAKSNAQSIADRLCKSHDKSELRDNAYRTYIQSISPAAYSSYDHCINTSKEVQINMLSGSEKEASMRVGFNSSSATRESGFIVDVTRGIDCSWYNVDHPINEPLQIDNGKSELLKCSRNASDEKGSINVVDKGSAALDTYLTIPWTAYKDKVPVSLITSYNNAYRELDAINKSLSGAVVAFNASKCPKGWGNSPTEWSGRYTVFSNSKQAPGTLVGSALAENENRSTGTHHHIGSVAFYGGDCQDDNGCATWGPKGGIKRTNTTTHNTLPSSDQFTVSDGTNAPYVTLIGCVRE